MNSWCLIQTDRYRNGCGNKCLCAYVCVWVQTCICVYYLYLVAVSTHGAQILLSPWRYPGQGSFGEVADCMSRPEAIRLLCCFVSEGRKCWKNNDDRSKGHKSILKKSKINIVTDYNPLNKAGNHESLITMKKWIAQKLNWEKGNYVVSKYLPQQIFINHQGKEKVCSGEDCPTPLTQAAKWTLRDSRPCWHMRQYFCNA